MKSKILLFLVQANYIIEFVTVYTLNTLKVIVGFIFVLSSFVILYNFLNNFPKRKNAMLVLLTTETIHLNAKCPPF